MASLTNVNIGKSLCRDELSTTGVFTCIVVVGHFFNNTTFIHHMSSNDFDLEAIDLAYEGQKMIENSIRHINKSNAKVVSLCDIFIVGCVDTDQFLKLENALHSIKTNFINMTPIDSKVSSVDLQTFLERIKYINITINYADNSIDYENIDDDHLQRERSISDITIISNKKLQPPLFCIIQYFGREHELCGGPRTVKPLIMYLYNFHYQCWHIIDRSEHDHFYSLQIKNVIKNFKGDLFSKITENLIDKIIQRIEH